MRCSARLLCILVCLLLPPVAFAAPATHFSVTAPASVNEVTQFPITVTALDEFNNVDTSYAGSLVFTSSSSYGYFPTGTKLTNGTAMPAAILGIPGSWTITATDSANSSITGTSNAITVKSAGTLALTKTADPMTVSAVGQTITYTYVVTNHTTQFMDVTPVDPPVVPALRVEAPAYPTTVVRFQINYTVTAADLANCQIQSTAVAVGLLNFGFGNNNVTVSNPSTVTVAVAPLPATFTSAAGTTFVVGEPGTFTISTQSCSTVTITGTGALPSGVTLTDNGNGTATLSGKPGPGTAGQYTITLGANNGMGSTQTFSLTVGKATSTVNLQSSLNPSMYGQAVTFTATVAPASPATGTPTGTVTFLDGGSSIGTGKLSGGVATFPTTALSVGSHVITAQYGGDSNFLASAPQPLSNTQTQTVNQAGQTIAFTSTPPANPTVTGSYTVGATGGSSGAPVVFSIDANSSAGACTIAGNVVTFTGTGTCVVDANQAGNTNYGAAQQVQQTIVVGKKSTTVSLAATPSPIVIGQTVTLTATVAGDPPTGSVSFTDNGTTLPCSPVTLVPGTTSATADCTVTLTGAGSHSIVATYSGDGNFAVATSSALVVTVNTPPVAAPMLDRWALLLLSGLLGAGVFRRLRRTERGI